MSILDAVKDFVKDKSVDELLDAWEAKVDEQHAKGHETVQKVRTIAKQYEPVIQLLLAQIGDSVRSGPHADVYDDPRAAVDEKLSLREQVARWYDNTGLLTRGQSARNPRVLSDAFVARLAHTIEDNYNYHIDWPEGEGSEGKTPTTNTSKE